MTQARIKETPSLIAQLFDQARKLFSAELKLAKRELSENMSKAGGGLAMLAIALLFALVALSALAVAATAGLVALGLDVGWAALIVCGAFLAIAAILALIGKSRLSGSALAPSRTIKQIKTDIETLEGSHHG